MVSDVCLKMAELHAQPLVVGVALLVLPQLDLSHHVARQFSRGRGLTQEHVENIRGSFCCLGGSREQRNTADENSHVSRDER